MFVLSYFAHAFIWRAEVSARYIYLRLSTFFSTIILQVYYTPQPMPLHHIPAPPYTANAPQNGPVLETTVQSPTGADMVAKNI